MHYSDYIRDYLRHYGGRLVIALSKRMFEAGANLHGLQAHIEIKHHKKSI